ncbi:protein of unknown function [Lysobacter enzymogenes]|nr:protein of unknown function [Lysobacter enzymogenes]
MGVYVGVPDPMPEQAPPMPLTDLAIRKAKPGPKPFKLFDSGGLYLPIKPAGFRYWRWKYRYAGQERLMAFGVFPEVSLTNARKRRDEARRVLANGIDPGEHRKAARAARGTLDAGSFQVIAREWLPLRDWVPAYRVKVEAWLEVNVFPWIGARPAAELTAADFLALARRIEARGALESAHRIMQKCGEIMRFAVATQRAPRNPVADLKGALATPPERHLAAVTDARSGTGLKASSGETINLRSHAPRTRRRRKPRPRTCSSRCPAWQRRRPCGWWRRRTCCGGSRPSSRRIAGRARCGLGWSWLLQKWKAPRLLAGPGCLGQTNKSSQQTESSVPR